MELRVHKNKNKTKKTNKQTNKLMNWSCPKSGQIPRHRHKSSNTSFHGER